MSNMSYFFSGQTKQAQDASFQPEYTQSPPTQPDGLEDHILNSAIGYKQGTSQPGTTDKQKAMRVLTRKGQMLDGNCYRLPNVTHAAMPRTKDDFEVVYHSDNLEAIREDMAADVGLQASYLNEAIARLEAGQLFQPEHEWHDDNVRNDQIPVSRFSPYDSPPRKTGLFRSLSKKVEGAIFGGGTPKRPEMSAPLRDFSHEPDGQAGIPSAVKYAIPILIPAAELANRADNVQEAVALKQLQKPSERPRLTLATLQKHQEQVAPQPEAATRKVRFVGSPDRETEFGDFMNLRDSISEDYIEVDEACIQQRQILEARAKSQMFPAPPAENVPGSPDPVTELGDFMDIRELPFRGGGPDHAGDDEYDRERRILQIRGLYSFRLSRDSWMPSGFPSEAALGSPNRPIGLGISTDAPNSDVEDNALDNGFHAHERDISSTLPVRQPSKRVDISKHSWMPPGCLPTTEPQTSAEYEPMSAGNPAIESLVGHIDQHMAEMDIADNRLSFASYETASPHRVTRANSLDTLGLGAAEEHEEREIMVDTFVQGKQVLWRAGERDGAKSTRKAQVAFLKERATRRAEDSVDEATILTKRLEALRRLEAENV